LTALALAAALVLPTYGVAPASAAEGAAPTVTHLTTNALENPLGISGEAPRLSWQLDSQRRGVTQSAYEIRVASTPAGLDASDTSDRWSSGKVESAQSLDVAYGGPALTSHERYYWSVRVWDDEGAVSAWSAPAWFETGLLEVSEWTADWIGADAKGIGAEWTDYTVEFTASDINSALGVYFRGRDTEHAYMWQISPAAGALRPHVKNPGYAVLSATPFPAGFDFTAAHDYRITVSGSTIETYVDGALLDSRTDSTHTAPGIVGFRTNGAEAGLVHDIKVTSANGAVLLDTHFPAGDMSFLAGTVTDDGLLVSGNAEAWMAMPDPVPLLRKGFAVADKPVADARVYASAQGVYELRLNGRPVGDQELAPGWTAYDKRIQYQTYDVTDLLETGQNAIGAEVADGWYSGRVGMFGPDNYGTRNALIAQLRIEYADGTVDVVGSDGSWRTTGGAVLSADLLDGERYDARRAEELGAWSSAPYDDSAWSPVVVRPSATSKLEPQDDQPVRVTQELSAKALPSPTPGAYIYDLEQNMVGVARVKLQGEPGKTVRIRYAEVLNPDGSIYTANLRTAKATDYYTFATDQPETYQPSFTFHGFRYVEITGLDEAPPASAITGVVMGTDGPLVSEFETSSPLLNQLHSNIVWGMRGNFLSIPTDTPARDERLGWTGDINVFSRTAVYNMDAQAFLSKWLQDLRDTQRADGALPGIAPIVPGKFDGGYGPAGWADAGVHVPWTVWQAYGDTNVIRENYAMMKRYVDYLAADSTNHIRSAGGYLDWLNLDDPTPADVLDTAFVAKSTREFAQMAAAVGNAADAAAYMQRYEDIRSAYQDAFIAADGTVKGDSQTSYILTITNDLVPDDRRAALTKQFIETIERRDWHLSTGFLGVDGLLPALSAVGRTDVAYRLLQNEDYPSWGYEIGKGATTIWERWNSIMPDGSFGPIEMNSFNHYAYGAAGEWMYRTLAGVGALEPGYKSVLIAPQPGGGITHANYSHETRYGTIVSNWAQADGGLTLDVSVPANTTATVRIPAENIYAVTEGGRPLGELTEASDVADTGDTVSLTIGSGDYSFAVDPVASAVGNAQVAIDALKAAVADLGLTAGPQQHVGATADAMTADVQAALGLVGGDRAGAAARIHAALVKAQGLTSWLASQDLSASARAALESALGKVVDALSVASAQVLGISATVVADGDEHLNGETVPVRVEVRNAGTAVRPGVEVELTAPDGWAVRPASVRHDVPAGGTAAFAFEVDVPVGATLGDNALRAAVRYTADGATVRTSAAGTVRVASPVTLGAATATPASGVPGTATVVSIDVTNRSAYAVTGRASVGTPAGWADPLTSAAVSIEPGETVSIDVPVAVSLDSNAGPATLVARFSDSGQVLAHKDVAYTVVQTLTPAAALDYVDLGVAASEQAHGLTAHPQSGTTVEAGRTRRYSNVNYPGSWFEFDLAHTPGQPFVLRAVETYDQAQTKIYKVFIDGKEVESRNHPRTAGAGLETYQFLVDDPALLTDSSVRVRFEYNHEGVGYDPSIADVWSLPVPADLPAPVVVADLDPVTASGGDGAHQVTVTLRGQDFYGAPVTDLEYRLDSGDYTAYTAPVLVTEDGLHTLTYRGTDAAGRVSAEGSVTFRVDAVGAIFAHLDELLTRYNADGTVSDDTTAALRDRLDKALRLAEQGSETRTIGYLEQFIDRANNRVKGDERDVMVRGLLVADAQRLITVLQEREAAENQR
jgi:hypothetical protein